jgi:hypothetical protein
MRLVRPGRTAVWTRERIEALSTAEVRQLRENAERLSEAEIVGLCDEILKARPRGGAKAAAMKNKRAAAA